MVKPIMLAPGQGTSLQVLADRIRVLATTEQTNGNYEIFELTGPQGSGPPLHLHAWDESYFMIEGTMDIRLGSESISAAPGSFILVPANTPHTFCISSASARFIVFTAKTGAHSFFSALDREVGFPPKSFEDVARVAERQGVHLV